MAAEIREEKTARRGSRGLLRKVEQEEILRECFDLGSQNKIVNKLQCLD